MNDRGTVHSNSANPTTPAAVPHDPSIIDLRRLLSSIEGDTRLMRELAMLFRTSSVKHLAVLATAVGKRDLRAIHEAAHAFKGSAGGIRAQELWNALEKIELAARAGDLDMALERYPSISPSLDRLVRHLDDILASTPV